MTHPFFEVPVPTVLGHRGAAGDAPENTLVSFARALEVGAHILESDVHVTADGVAVLAHDPRVDRICNGSGAIEDLPVAALQELDAGARFSPDGGASFPFRDQGLVIPTLEAAFATFPEARFNLEVKHAGAVAPTVELVEKFGRADITLLVAGETDIMASLRAELARRHVSPALSASVGDVLAFVQAALSGAAPDPGVMALQIPAEFAGGPLITPELVAHAHAHGVWIHAWTINEEAEMARLLDLGVDGLVTDFPERMVRLLARRRADP